MSLRLRPFKGRYTLYDDGEWYDKAACADGLVDAELFFLDPGEHGLVPKGVCASCPVRGECLWTALHNYEDYAIWGGLAPNERARILRVEPEFALSLEPAALLERYPVRAYIGGRSRWKVFDAAS